MAKCPKCRLPGGVDNFHICVDLSYRAPGEGVLRPPGPHPNRGRVLGRMPGEQRENLSNSLKEYWRRKKAMDSAKAKR